jgi:drug/metabolite transporter (DMT)-like permease
MCAFAFGVFGVMLIVGPLPVHADYAGAILCAAAVLAVVRVGVSMAKRHRHRDR